MAHPVTDLGCSTGGSPVGAGAACTQLHPVTDLGRSTGGSPVGAEAACTRPTPSPISAVQPAAVQSEQGIRLPAHPANRVPPAPLPLVTPTVERTNPPLRRAQGVGQIAQSAVQAQNSVEITHAVPIRLTRSGS